MATLTRRLAQDGRLVSRNSYRKPRNQLAVFSSFFHTHLPPLLLSSSSNHVWCAASSSALAGITGSFGRLGSRRRISEGVTTLVAVAFFRWLWVSSNKPVWPPVMA